MGEITLNPFGMVGYNANQEDGGLAAEGGLAVTKHVESGGFEGFFSGLASASYTAGENRITGSAALHGMLVWPLIKTIGPRVSYNLDDKEVEVGAMACVQTLIPATGDFGFFGGACFTANDLSQIKDDGVSGLFMFTGQF